MAENKIGKAVTMAERKQLWYDIRYRKYAPVFLGQVKPRMKLWTAAVKESELPPPRLNEVAMCGRSNSGKSTLVNYLCGHHSAKMKREPGSTQELVFWQIGTPAQLCLVDLPGYGYAVATEEKRLQWTEFALWYLKARKNLKLVLLLVDARAGIKAMDREMIAYLERSSVPWQIVVTKCDKVKKRTLAKRITIMKEETASFRKVTGDPIPISALKSQLSVNALRELLDRFKVRKEIVKDGIRKRVYDLLEIRRMKRAEKAARRAERLKETREKEEEAKRQAEDAAADGGAEAQRKTTTSPDEAGSEPYDLHPDLHELLDDFGQFRVAGVSAGEAKKSSSSSASPQASEKEEGPTVRSVHYPLEDRDSVRIDRLASAFFDIDIGHDTLKPIGGSRRGGELRAAGVDGGVAASMAAAPPTLEAASVRAHHATVEAPFPFIGGSGGGMDDLHGFGRRSATAGLEDLQGFEAAVDSGSDDDEDAIFVQPSVQRFDPAPKFASRREETASASRPRLAKGLFEGAQSSQGFADAEFPSLFPGFKKPPAYPSGPATVGASETTSEVSTVGLRVRPGMRDQIYDRDDFASPEDLASGIRRGVAPAPTPETAGRYLAEARKRYEREWAMELEDLDRVRSSVTDGGEAPAAAPKTGGRKSAAPTRGDERRFQMKLVDKTGTKTRYITQEGNKPIPKTKALYKVLGRPPTRILKKKHEADAAQVLGWKDRRGRKRNAGAGMDYDEAREKWQNWFKRKKHCAPTTAYAAASPKLEDVEAAYMERLQRRRVGRFGGGAQRFNQRFEERGGYGGDGDSGGDRRGYRGDDSGGGRRGGFHDD